MAPKKTAPDAADAAPDDGAAKRGQSAAARDEKGRLKKGHGMPGPGRPALPDFFKQKAPDALKKLLDVALGKDKDIDEPNLRVRALETCVAYIYGPPQKARHERFIPMDEEERMRLVEATVVAAAVEGNVDAALAYLEAKDPQRWGKQKPDDGDADMVDTIDFVPMVQTSTAAPAPGSTTVAASSTPPSSSSTSSSTSSSRPK